MLVQLDNLCIEILCTSLISKRTGMFSLAVALSTVNGVMRIYALSLSMLQPDVIEFSTRIPNYVHIFDLLISLTIFNSASVTINTSYVI